MIATPARGPMTAPAIQALLELVVVGATVGVGD